MPKARLTVAAALAAIAMPAYPSRLYVGIAPR